MRLTRKELSSVLMSSELFLVYLQAQYIEDFSSQGGIVKAR